ncbi:MAG: hypothetical protein OEZ43_01215 [Gammaproteobacteria bacterium]|nr:hypothetical protein [Gammaproteobacteria bacterium]
MIQFPQSLCAIDGEGFERRFVAFVQTLSTDALLLQQGLQYSSVVSESPFSAMLLSTTQDDTRIYVRVRILYSGVIAGCACADDPSPPIENPEQCDLEFSIEKRTGQAKLVLLEQ